MTDRYFVETPITGGEATLAGHEAHHLIRVMRASRGSRVVLFDGSGAEFNARVERIGRGAVELTILCRNEVDRELPLDLTLGVSLPKGDRQRWLVEKAVELGVKRLVPLVTARSVARAWKKALARLGRTVIEASKQCGRNRLMEIAQPQGWPEFVAATQTAPCRLLAHPECPAAGAGESVTPAPREQVFEAVVLAVGPEGGFTPDEVSLAATAGWHLVNLGPRILRTETAAILLTSLALRGVTGR
ncbi:MAG: hypothetical protein A2V98_06345 [Planctomycetes bacterium RBG_16_64_12]|nr:MAG: hypothetical protein A2V98_06345 [Planctomycetes bacterium RBG_16_64_12]